MKVIIQIIVLLLLSNFCFGQYSISGIVIDQNGLTLPSIYVALYDNDSIVSYTQSNVDGEFVLENIIRPDNKYIVAHQSIESSDTLTLGKHRTENLQLIIHVTENNETIYIPAREKQRFENNLFYAAIPTQKNDSILIIKGSQIILREIDFFKYSAFFRIFNFKTYRDNNGILHKGMELIELDRISSTDWLIENLTPIKE